MDISNIASQSSITAGQSSQSAENAGKNEMGQDKFLQLLVAQMRNQDPVNPMDSKEFASQLAQFNSVEQLIGVNKGLKSLQDSQELMRVSQTNSMAASLTGKHIKAFNNQLYLAPAENASVDYKLSGPAERVDIIVRDASGSEVRRETLKNVPSGENSWQWEGRDNAGVRMADGVYNIEVKASNGDSQVKSQIFTEGVADKVRYTGEGVLLSLNGVQVPIGDVEEVGNSNQ